ncbi:restriction endonuclease subunit S [Kutzneria sp. NPDC051319]|uniref:restriction endonuclease subunit S n=1 Tax=Kutzneria sp. NPDC051319 TaxID=3155047 RepID=UPI00342109C3
MDGLEYRTMGVRWYGKGAYDRGIGTTETIKAKRLYRATAGDFVFNRIDTQKGAFDVVPDGLDGALATNEFPLYTTDSGRLLAGFLLLYFRQESVLRAIANSRAGSEGRARWKEADFEAWRVPLPPIGEQHRIVHLMSTVDAQVQALRAEIGSARHLHNRLLAESFENTNGHESAIVNLCSHVVGGIWGSPEGESEVDVLALGPRIYAPGTSDFVTDGSPVRSFTLKQINSRLVHENDIILERSGGSADQPVGRVVIAGSGLSPCIPTDFQRLMRPDPARVEPRYLFWRLQHDWNQGLTRNYSRRTTGITNLSVKDYIARVIQIPDRAEQVDLVQRADAVETAVRAAEEELTHLRAFRSTLLTALLNQEIEIPESYDDLLGAVS